MESPEKISIVFGKVNLDYRKKDCYVWSRVSDGSYNHMWGQPVRLSSFIYSFIYLLTRVFNNDWLESLSVSLYIVVCAQEHS